MARKSGAWSGTSTGPAPERLRCFRKRVRLRKKAEQPPVDGREAKRDQEQPGEVLRRQMLAEEEAAEQDCDRRHQQGDEQGVGRAGSLDETEIEHVTEGGAEQRQRDDRAPSRQRRKGV